MAFIICNILSTSEQFKHYKRMTIRREALTSFSDRAFPFFEEGKSPRNEMAKQVKSSSNFVLMSSGCQVRSRIIEQFRIAYRLDIKTNLCAELFT